MKLRQVKTVNNAVDRYSIIVSGASDTAMDELIDWCCKNLLDSDIWVYKINRTLVTRLHDGKDRKLAHVIEVNYQLSYLTEKDLLMFQLRWIDYIDEIPETEYVIKF